jgi:hypothetical protein
VTPLLAFYVFSGYSPACTLRGGFICSLKIGKFGFADDAWHKAQATVRRSYACGIALHIDL